MGLLTKIFGRKEQPTDKFVEQIKNNAEIRNKIQIYNKNVEEITKRIATEKKLPVYVEIIPGTQEQGLVQEIKDLPLYELTPQKLLDEIIKTKAKDKEEKTLLEKIKNEYNSPETQILIEGQQINPTETHVKKYFKRKNTETGEEYLYFALNVVKPEPQKTEQEKTNNKPLEAKINEINNTLQTEIANLEQQKLQAIENSGLIEKIKKEYLNLKGIEINKKSVDGIWTVKGYLYPIIDWEKEELKSIQGLIQYIPTSGKGYDTEKSCSEINLTPLKLKNNVIHKLIGKLEVKLNHNSANIAYGYSEITPTYDAVTGRIIKLEQIRCEGLNYGWAINLPKIEYMDDKEIEVKIAGTEEYKKIRVE